MVTPGKAVGDDVARLEEVARRIRVEIVRTIHKTGVGHLGGSLSEADLLTALYFRELRIRPEQPDWTDRDRFVLSKGHASVGLYATLAMRGYFPVAELLTFDSHGSRLQGHPDMTRLPGLDMSTGSLGLGISAAVGIALGARTPGHSYRTYVLVGCRPAQTWPVCRALTCPPGRWDWASRRRWASPSVPGRRATPIEPTSWSEMGSARRARSGKPPSWPRTTASTTSWPSSITTGCNSTAGRETPPSTGCHPRRPESCAPSGRRSAGGSSRSMGTTWKTSSTHLHRHAPPTGVR